ncbi:ATP-binding protein [Pararcticibacter amylolyticus]|uniref:Transcriptional regulator n=1 Tax=Pararcticibacter amylolyticus TaxID=2173175 RepID=A0A2U2PDU8_9SPHI|nr:ATP-binding protein [Pararcticibacter amylolyticus]PWG79530.1 transcriptional regulator [Pararcticibacter amylolyticus]
MSEHQNIEYKQSWRDEYLKWICGFANAQGGRIYIGIDDRGGVTGIDEYKKLMDDLPNKIVNYLGLVVDVNLHEKEGKHYIEINVPASTVPISYHGVYHYRSGSTKQELKGTGLHDFLLKKIGRTWDDTIVEGATIGEIDESAVASFLKACVKSGRIYQSADKDDLPAFLQNLDLITDDGKLRAAAILLFGKRPQRYFIHSYFKIGKFGNSDADLRFQDIVEGNIFEMADKVVRLLKERYLVSPVSYEGIQRIEKLEYPEPALREAILNAIVHKDYTSTTIQLSVYDDKLMLWNPGQLPVDIPLERLTQKHPSRPRNKHIAEAFFRAGYIESWGRGIEEILTAFKKADLPEPVFEELWEGVMVTFLKDIYNEEYLKKKGLTTRQIKGLVHIKQFGRITNGDYQRINETSERTATRDLQELVEMRLIIKAGSTGKGTYYFLK